MNIERLFYNLFYIFGSWALIHFAFLFGYVCAKGEGSPKKKVETLLFIFAKVGLAFVGIAWLAILSGFYESYGRKFFTLEGFIQAVIVLTVPATTGVWKAIKENRENLKKFEESIRKLED